MPIYSTHNVLPKFKKDGDQFYPDLLEPNNPGGYIHFLYEPDIISTADVPIFQDISSHEVECRSCGCSISKYVKTMNSSWKCSMCQDVNYFPGNQIIDTLTIPEEYTINVTSQNTGPDENRQIGKYRLFLVLDACVSDLFELKQYQNYLKTLSEKFSEKNDTIPFEISCFWIFPDSKYYTVDLSGEVKLVNGNHFPQQPGWISVAQFQERLNEFQNFVKIQPAKKGRRVKRNIPFDLFGKVVFQTGTTHTIYKCNVMLLGGCTTKDGKIVSGELKDTIRDFQKHKVSDFRKKCDYYSKTIGVKSAMTYQFFICSLHDCGIWEMFSQNLDSCDLVMFLDEFEGNIYESLFRSWWDSFFLQCKTLKVFSSYADLFKNCGLSTIGLNRKNKQTSFLDKVAVSDISFGLKGTAFELNSAHVQSFCSTFQFESLKLLSDSDQQHLLLKSHSSAEYPDSVLIQYELEYIKGLSHYKKVTSKVIPVLDVVDGTLMLDVDVLSVVLGKQNLHEIWRFTATNLGNTDWKIRESNMKINSLVKFFSTKLLDYSKRQIAFSFEKFLQLVYMMKFSTKLLNITNVSPDEYIKEALLKWGGYKKYKDLVLDISPVLYVFEESTMNSVVFDLSEPLLKSVHEHKNLVLELPEYYLIRGDSEFLKQVPASFFFSRKKPFIKVKQGLSQDRLVINKLYPTIYLAKQNVLFDFRMYKSRVL